MSLSKFEKKANYTNTDLAGMIRELHNCVHVVDKKMDQHIDTVGKTFGLIRGEVAEMRGQVGAIERAVNSSRNVPTVLPEQPKAAGWLARLRKVSPAEAVIMILVAIAGSGQVWQFLVVVGRAVIVFWQTH